IFIAHPFRKIQPFNAAKVQSIYHWPQCRKSNAVVTLDASQRHAWAAQGAPLHPTSALGYLASLLRVRPTANVNFAFGAADGIAYVANRVNQRRLTELFPEPANKHPNQLGIVFVRVLPHAF